MYESGFRDMPVRAMIEDPVHRRSHDSYFVQMADVCSFCSYQFIDPGKRMKKSGGKNYFLRLSPILLRVASRTDEWGRVWC